jgi:hypothetical protein
MIPPFDESGYLPPGVHRATMDEITARFGRESELRRVQMESISWLIDIALRAGVQRIVLNGSFVTDIIEPNDVDCVLLFQPGQIKNVSSFEELEDGLPFLDIALAAPKEFDVYVNQVFGKDRLGNSNGMIEVIL